MNAFPVVTLESVSKVFRQGKTDIHALDNVSLNVPTGQFVAIMGASGSGKSTLLHLIAGLTPPTSGQIKVFGQRTDDLTDDQLTGLRRRSIGLIFQAYNLLPTMTALENVCLPLILGGQSLRRARPQGERLLALVDLSDRINHRPDELSGGQQQRVAIARALIHEAPLLLADEPTGNLDSKTGDDVLCLLRKLVSETNRTILMVTHDPEAAAYADHVVILSDGRVVQQRQTTPRAAR